jgi:hypothetical protein
MPLQATSGAASYDAFGGGVPVVPNYIEDVFSTYLYTGTGSAQTITNGIDFSTKGGLLWLKARNDTRNNWLYDTTRSIANGLRSDSVGGQTSTPDALTAFNNNGFSIGTSGNINTSGNTLVSWSFRKQPKFFDVVTWTGDDASSRTITHNLGSVPGFIVVKDLGGNQPWPSYHRSLGATKGIYLSSTAASEVFSGLWNNTEPTSTQFTVGYYNNSASATYVAYLFAHNAGGFGLTGTDNVISCGTWTGTGSNLNVNLGYEPQWLMFKRTDDVGDWIIVDNMRGFTTTGADAYLKPNTSGAETSVTGAPAVNATGFSWTTGASTPYIYIAIRRGPMKVPTSGTSVFAPVLQNGGNVSITTNFPVDLLISKPPASAGQAPYFMDRLRGGTTNNYVILMSSNTDAEITGTGTGLGFQSNTAIQSQNSFYSSSTPVIWLNFRRAPSFFDEVVAKGNDADTSNWPHNLGVPPELIIRKSRTNAYGWSVWAGAITGTGAGRGLLSSSAAWASGSNAFLYNGVSTNMTSSYFSTSGGADINSASDSFVTYLFATCAGVSKVGSYTGTATTKQIDCGFTAGARFVLIKRTDSTGSWYVWDSSRGIVSGNDPYLLLNSTAAEVTNTDYIDAYSAGFEISSTAPAEINASGGTYIFLSIA